MKMLQSRSIFFDFRNAYFNNINFTLYLHIIAKHFQHVIFFCDCVTFIPYIENILLVIFFCKSLHFTWEFFENCRLILNILSDSKKKIISKTLSIIRCFPPQVYKIFCLVYLEGLTILYYTITVYTAQPS